MQEEVEQRIVSLMISCGKLGEQEFRKAVAKLLEQLKNDRQKHQYSKANPHGKMTVKQLAAKDKGLQSIEVTDQNIGSFNRIARKYGILKLVTTLIANTKGEGKAGDDFWVKAETLLYTALIGYIHYEAPMEEQNFSTLIEFINAMEVREDDEDFKNPVDLMFDELKKRKPDHFAVRQYAKFKLSAGDICSK